MKEFQYTFGFKDGITPEASDSLWAEKAIETLLEKILPTEEMQRRRIIKLYRRAISEVAQEIIERRISSVTY